MVDGACGHHRYTLCFLSSSLENHIGSAPKFFVLMLPFMGQNGPIKKKANIRGFIQSLFAFITKLVQREGCVFHDGQLAYNSFVS